MALVIKCDERMRVKVGEDVYIYTDARVSLKFVSPKNIRIQREYLQGEGNTSHEYGQARARKREETAQVADGEEPKGR